MWQHTVLMNAKQQVHLACAVRVHSIVFYANKGKELHLHSSLKTSNLIVGREPKINMIVSESTETTRCF
jgi:hypothetical protein